MSVSVNPYDALRKYVCPGCDNHPGRGRCAKYEATYGRDASEASCKVVKCVHYITPAIIEARAAAIIAEGIKVDHE